MDAQQFLPACTAEERLRAYALYGGTPAYLQTIQPETSLQVNILDSILTRGSLPYDEGRLLLQQELRKPRHYYAVRQALASGDTRQNEIKQAAGLDNIVPYRETLQHLHLVERVVPVPGSHPHTSRRGIYRLKDHFLRFWFRFVPPGRSQLERGAKRMLLDTVIAPELDHFTSITFEQACRQYFRRNGLKDSLPFQPKQIGGLVAGPPGNRYRLAQ